jgi:DNA-binding MarR family transcriptional regulator
LNEAVASTKDPDYQRLLDFRKELRRFLRWSEQSARNVGLTPAQHQLLLAIKGHLDGAPTISDVADDLMLRHHSVSELIDRAATAGLVDRQTDPDDRRLTRLQVTPEGEAVLRRLTRQHVAEIQRLAPIIEALNDDG